MRRARAGDAARRGCMLAAAPVRRASRRGGGGGGARTPPPARPQMAERWFLGPQAGRRAAASCLFAGRIPPALPSCPAGRSPRRDSSCAFHAFAPALPSCPAGRSPGQGTPARTWPRLFLPSNPAPAEPVPESAGPGRPHANELGKARPFVESHCVRFRVGERRAAPPLRPWGRLACKRNGIRRRCLASALLFAPFTDCQVRNHKGWHGAVRVNAQVGLPFRARAARCRHHVHGCAAIRDGPVRLPPPLQPIALRTGAKVLCKLGPLTLEAARCIPSWLCHRSLLLIMGRLGARAAPERAPHGRTGRGASRAPTLCDPRLPAGTCGG